MTLQEQLENIRQINRLGWAYEIQEILCSEPDMTEKQRVLLKAANRYIDSITDLDHAIEYNNLTEHYDW